MATTTVLTSPAAVVSLLQPLRLTATATPLGVLTTVSATLAPASGAPTGIV